MGWRGGVAFPPPGGPPRGGFVLSSCAAMRVTVACATASATLNGPVASHVRIRRHGDLWDLVVLLQVVSLGCVEWFVSVWEAVV